MVFYISQFSGFFLGSYPQYGIDNLNSILYRVHLILLLLYLPFPRLVNNQTLRVLTILRLPGSSQINLVPLSSVH